MTTFLLLLGQIEKRETGAMHSITQTGQIKGGSGCIGAEAAYGHSHGTVAGWYRATCTRWP